MTTESKKEIRRRIAQEKKRHSREEKEQLSAALLQKLEQCDFFGQADCILLYYALPDEVQTQAFVAKWGGKKQLLLPVVVGDTLELRRYTGPQDLQVGAYGIEEPTGEVFTDYDTIRLAIIPGVSFDAKGHRLGRGKGYYDRLLPHLRHCRKVGICYSFQRSEDIPCEAHDIPMDHVLTDQGFLTEK